MVQSKSVSSPSRVNIRLSTSGSGEETKHRVLERNDPRYHSMDIQEKASLKGLQFAHAHYPYALIEDGGELRSFAIKQCDSTIWKFVKDKEGHEEDYSEVKRIFAAAFTGSYLDTVEKRRREDKKGRQGVEQKQAL
jgi:hypothetical protein